MNDAVPEVQALLSLSAPAGAELEPAACDFFAGLVLRSSDCKRHFFDLFMPCDDDYGAAQFRSRGVSVAWWHGVPAEDTLVAARLGEPPTIALRSPSQIKSILHGVRYWARD